jgi:hypothetical protein
LNDQLERFVSAALALVGHTVAKPLTEEQRRELHAPLPRDVIKRLPGKPAEYVSGHYVIDRLNKVFGHDGWTDTYEPPVVVQGDRPLVHVRGSLTAGGVTRWDTGVGVAADGKVDSLETALKGAFTDCLKRNARKLGDSFGLALYEKVEGGRQRSGVGISTTALSMLEDIAELSTAEAVTAWSYANAEWVKKLDDDERDIIRGEVAARRRTLNAAAATPAPAPAPTPAPQPLPPAASTSLAAFYARLEQIELPGESVAVWMKYRAELAPLPVADREGAWKALCERTEVVGRMRNAGVWLKKAIHEEDTRKGFPVGAQTTKQPDAPALATFRSRATTAPTFDALVATCVELGPSVSAHLSEAWAIARARAADLGANPDHLVPAVEAARAVSPEPAHWHTVGLFLSGLAAAAHPAPRDAVMRQHGAAVAKLPEVLRARMRAELTAARNHVLPTDQAAALEAELRAAGNIPEAEAVGDRAAEAYRSGRITTDQIKRLAALQDAIVSAMEREPAEEAA